MRAPLRPGTLTLRNAQVMDRAGVFVADHDVVVRDGVIESVAPAAGPVTGESLDLTGLWLMPGVVDCHAHLACFEEDTLRYLSMSTSRWALECAGSAARLLDQGVTFVRDPCGADAGVRDGIHAGLVPGPTTQVAVSALSQTGGHGDGHLPGVGLEASNGFLMHEYPGRPPYLADGVDDVRRAVRLIVRAGADWIKICTTGGLLSPGHDHPDVPEFDADEIEAIVREATRAGKPVMSHAYGGSGLTDAVTAGVRSIEHGARLSEEQAALMARRGTFLVPTLSVLHELVRLRDDGAVSESVAAKVSEVEPLIGEAVRVARAAGVPIALGTDLTEQVGNLAEIAYLHRAGLTPQEALLAATANGAELCGQSDVRGRLEPGLIGDAIVLAADPSDPEVFLERRNVVGVIQGGRVHRWSAEPERRTRP
ncbi:amidohydrolase family protein [Nocardioides sp. SLBN-35]|uniref:metal-dependent hydrolase family protein n=1 Tax=Nocardioides sp. SLBN-35 TaxID=2768445 RepID=UPI00114D611C|nr:amidohydrolase family protein [Nocardioides sp. SLBN-35]TQK72439.1 imidazolonepropionase-like amidohydrolase [Nocardioides sp. SLBN-35]